MIVDPSIPQAQPLPATGVMSSAQIVDHLDKVLASQPKPVQDAVDHAHSSMGLNSPSTALQGAPPQMPATQSLPAMADASSGGMGPVTQPVRGIAPSRSDMPDHQPLPLVGEGSVPVGMSSSAHDPSAGENPHMQNLERMTAEGPGYNKIHNPFLKGLAMAGNVVGSGLFPQFAQFIPGTSAHHEQLIGQEENQLGQEQKATKATDDSAQSQATTEHEKAVTGGLPASQALDSAEAQNYLSEAEARNNPELQIVAHPVIDPNDESKTPRTGYFNKKTGAMTYGPEVGAAPVAESNKPSIEKMENGDVVAVHYDPTTKANSTEVVYHGDPKVETDITKLEVNGKPHSVIVNKKTGATIKDLGETGEKPPTVNVNQGTWSIQEDADGKPIEYNSKTGETRAVAAGGVQKAGTKEKEDTKLAPGKDALSYANQYLTGGKFTGSGDEALLEKFFELAKPSNGFRMSQPQIDLLQNSRGYLGTVKAIAHHGLTGTWFDDGQRKEIVDTMRNIVSSKGAAGQLVHYSENGVDYDIPHDKVAAFEAKHPSAKKQ